jgi:2-iminobutanoate/2-iminopropanoate deaminase
MFKKRRKIMKKTIETKNAPAVVGPYSQAIQIGDLIFCSGQIAIDSQSNNFVDGDVKIQTKQVFKNLSAVLKEAGVSIDDVVKTTVYLQNMTDYKEMNEVYASYFKKPFPARAAVEVSKLPKEALVEIECIAVKKNKDGCCGNCECK